MKVVRDEDLSVLHSYTQPIAKKMAKRYADKIIKDIVELLNNDEKFGDLNYCGAMTFISTVNNGIFMNLFNFACYVGKKFPDVEHCSQDLFEEMVQGFRILTNYKEPDRKEYAIGGIKKVNVK